MTDEKLKKEIIDLYEKLERDKDLYKEFLEDEDKFLEARGFVPSEVKGLVNNIVDTGIDLLKAKGDPEAMKAVLELKEQKAEYTEEHIEYERIMAADRASARRREINIAKLGKIDFMLYLTGMVALGCFVAVVYVMLSGQLPENAIVHQIIGLLEGMVIAIVSYYFGSSKNSNNQDKK